MTAGFAAYPAVAKSKCGNGPSDFKALEQASVQSVLIICTLVITTPYTEGYTYVCFLHVKSYFFRMSLKQNEAQSTRAKSTHKGVKYLVFMRMPGESYHR